MIRLNIMEFAERAVCWVYIRGKLLFLKLRFPGRIEMTKAFRKPFYCRVSNTGSISVGERTSFNWGCVLVSHERIEIGGGAYLVPTCMSTTLTMAWLRTAGCIATSRLSPLRFA